MRYRRRARTPEQQAKQDIVDRLQFRADVIACGLAVSIKFCDTAKDFQNIEAILYNDLQPAIGLLESPMEELHGKRRKTPPGRTIKTRSKDPKPTEAKKKKRYPKPYALIREAKKKGK